MAAERRPRPRPYNLDGTGPGAWFLTINARAQLFGRIVEGEMLLNRLGAIVQAWLLRLPDHHSHVRRDAFVVMPDHVHNLLVLVAPAPNSVSRIERFGAPVSGSVATIVRSFKAGVTRAIREALGSGIVVWQDGYHARRIMDEEGMRKVRQYIRDNPANAVSARRRNGCRCVGRDAHAVMLTR